MEAKLTSLPARLKEYVVQGPRAEDAAVVSNENDYNGLVEEVRRRDRETEISTAQGNWSGPAITSVLLNACGNNTLRSKMLSQADRNYSTRSQSSQACAHRKWAPPVKVIRSQNHRRCIPPASTISFSAMHQVQKEANNYL